MTKLGFYPSSIVSGGGSANVGTVLLDFGAFPGAVSASVAITGQAGILASSLVEAWVLPLDTADHSADEHMMETLGVFAATIVAGVGFTVYGFNTNQRMQDQSNIARDLGFASVRDRSGPGPGRAQAGQLLNDMIVDKRNQGTFLYGLWSVGWRWT